MPEMWHYGEADDGILRVTIDCRERPVNVFFRAALEELRELIRAIRNDSSIRGVLFQSGKPGVFIAGADITEFENLTDTDAARDVSEFGQTVFRELEELRVPTVALIAGACLGGGLEFAMACTYRVASDHEKTKIGLPEVQLGLLPGWGGTVRLPQLIGLVNALPLILSGRQLGGFQARSKGIVHETVPAEALRSVGEKILRTHFEQGSARGLFRRSKTPGWRKAIENSRFVKNYALKKAESEVQFKTHGHYPAPLAIIRTLRKQLASGTKQSFDIERDEVANLAADPVTRECIRLFFLQEGARKPPQELTVAPRPDELNQAVVLGAGAMGAGIALLFARKDVAVRLKDINEDCVSRGVQTTRKLLGKDVKRRKLTKRQAEQVSDRLSPTVDYRGLKHADIAIEAVLEKVEIKRQVFCELAEAAHSETVLATNTSSLLVSDIARGVPNPERVVGLHFFNPPHRMPLVEVIHTRETSPEALAVAFAAVQRLGKTPVVVGDCAGFLVNRLLGPYMNEAGFLLSELDDPMEIDRAAVAFGMPMGPLALSDLVGLEVANHVAGNLFQAYGDRMKPAPIWHALNEQPVGNGEKPKLLVEGEKQLSPNVLQHIRGMQTAGRRSHSNDEIAERLIFPVINEAARCLDEGIARNADDIDLAMVFGTGFAPFRGGPMRYAESIGLSSVVETLERMSETLPHLTPSDALKRFAAMGSFSSVDSERSTAAAS